MARPRTCLLFSIPTHSPASVASSRSASFVQVRSTTPRFSNRGTLRHRAFTPTGKMRPQPGASPYGAIPTSPISPPTSKSTPSLPTILTPPRAPPSPIHLLALVFLHIIGAALIFSFLEHWTFLNALYFSVTCFSTVGYGDLTVTHDVSKIFAALYALISVALVGGVLAAALDGVVERQTAMVKGLQARLSGAILNKREELEEHTLVQSAEEAVKRAWCTALTSGISLFLICSLGGAVYGWLQDLRLVDTLHLVVATLTTVGWGDVSPATPRGRAFAIVWLVLSSMGLANFLAHWGEYKLKRDELSQTKKLLSPDAVRAVFESIDTDGDGRLNRVEWISYVLSRMGKTSAEEVREICYRFEQLDVDSDGFITYDELDT